MVLERAVDLAKPCIKTEIMEEMIEYMCLGTVLSEYKRMEGEVRERTVKWKQITGSD